MAASIFKSLAARIPSRRPGGGLGLAFLPDFFIQEDLKAGRLIEISREDPPSTLPITALYPSRQYLPLKVRVFVDFMADKLSPVMN